MIETLILQYLPTLIAVLSSVGLVAKALSIFNKIKNDNAANREYNDVKVQLAICIQQNNELKRQVKDLLEAIEHVRRN